MQPSSDHKPTFTGLSQIPIKIFAPLREKMQLYNNMSKIRVTKVFIFDMAHALDGYNGLCKNIHGHTYHLRVTVSGSVHNDDKQPDNGMVIDFGNLKQLVREEILDKFDHSLVLKDTSAFLQSGSIPSGEKLIRTPFQPSCENLLIHFVSAIEHTLPPEVRLVAMRLDETPTSYAEWFLSDQ